PAFLMRTSAPVALWWSPGLLNHTVEPLKSLAVGTARPSDQMEPASSHWSRLLQADGEKQKKEGGSMARRLDSHPLAKKLSFSLINVDKLQLPRCRVARPAGPLSAPRAVKYELLRCYETASLWLNLQRGPPLPPPPPIR
ncbi:unnamed protein product, partial [Pleuronectes platessa]